MKKKRKTRKVKGRVVSRPKGRKWKILSEFCQ